MSNRQGIHAETSHERWIEGLGGLETGAMREAGAVEEICFGDFGTEKWLNCRAGGVEKDANGRGGRRRAAADKEISSIRRLRCCRRIGCADIGGSLDTLRRSWQAAST